MTTEQIKVQWKARARALELTSQSTANVLGCAKMNGCSPDILRELEAALVGCEAALELGIFAALTEESAWNPIETLHRLGTDIILWNPCDGVHTLSILTSLEQLDQIRRGEVYTHWQKVEPPTIGDR